MQTARGKIYVVDDDAAFLGAIVRLLRVAGYEVTASHSIASLTRHLPFPPGSCVLADVLLDGESGLDIPTLLHVRGEAAPVVFMSATDDETTTEAAGRSSGAPCLRKPVEAGDLFRALEAALAPSKANPQC